MNIDITFKRDIFEEKCRDPDVFNTEVRADFIVSLGVGSEMRVATLEGLFLEGSEAVPVGTSLFDLADCIDDCLHDTVTPFLGEDNCSFNKEIMMDDCCDLYSLDILYIKDIKVLPCARHKNVGEYLLRSVVQKVQRAGIVIIPPYPLQFHYEDKEELSDFDHKMHYEKLNDNVELSRSILVDKFQEWGFLNYKGSMYCFPYEFLSKDLKLDESINDIEEIDAE